MMDVLSSLSTSIIFLEVFMSLLNNLNDMQYQAVIHTEGPLLILAGAGSGKTNVLTHRIAYLIEEKNVYPSNILAITFTNKAAKEMKERIQKKVGSGWESIWVGTFHSICMRILRRDIEKIGYDKNFVIFDTSDQKTLINDCLKRLNIDDKKFPFRSVLAEISKAKDDMLNPSMYLRAYQGDFRLETIGKVFELYQKELHKNNALDFDDIITNTILLLSTNQELLSFYQNKFRYIHVDEYQDTNNTQYTLVSMLAGGYGNLCVVGDDDQSIYGWRGANIKNILNFEKEFKNCRVVKLEQNYRSTNVILNAANSVILNNSQRKSKKLWTENVSGEKIIRYIGLDHVGEATFVAEEIKKLSKQKHLNLSDFAILYRTNAQSRSFEDAFMREGLPYKLVGSLKFYDRKEIKDLTGYLRVLSNPSDNVSLKRIINVPRRGIGNTTIEVIQNIAEGRDVTYFSIVQSAQEIPELKRPSQKLYTFSLLINKLRSLKEAMGLTRFIELVLDETGLLLELEEDSKNDNITRIENLKEFVSVAKEFEFANPDATLEEFLEGLSLTADADSIDEETENIFLMTLHSAKGLEFPVVFMVGLEEGVFPSYRSIFEESQLEEERRLCYVGITRAQQKLYLVHVSKRMLYGNTSYNPPSRFLEEIPEELIEINDERQSLQENSNQYKRNFSQESSLYESRTGNIGSQFSISGNTSSSYKIMQPGLSPFPKKDIPSFKVGDTVKHKKFGVGSIIEMHLENEDYRLNIDFDEHGRKQLMANYSNLILVES
jgi:DNA helicase-2/ATP-dependent DNA helicase PcrA